MVLKSIMVAKPLHGTKLSIIKPFQTNDGIFFVVSDSLWEDNSSMACIYVASYVKKKVKCPAMKMEEKTDLVPLTVK